MDKAPVEAGKAAAATDDKIQTEVEALGGEKNLFPTLTSEPPVETGKEAVAIGNNQAETCAELDRPADVNSKYRLPDDCVSSILAMPGGTPFDNPYLQGHNLAEIMGVTEEWLEEEADRMQRISDDFVLFQDKVREEFDRQGYVEVDEEYLTNVAKMQEFSDELKKGQDWSGMEFADRNDPDYASWYEHCEPVPVPAKRLLLREVNREGNVV